MFLQIECTRAFSCEEVEPRRLQYLGLASDKDRAAMAFNLVRDQMCDTNGVALGNIKWQLKP